MKPKRCTVCGGWTYHEDVRSHKAAANFLGAYHVCLLCGQEALP